jgi:hypothetical protein
MKLVRSLLVLAALFTAGSVHATMLYSAAPNQSGGTDINCCLGADGFALGADSTLTQIMFWTLQSSATDYTGSVVWAIYSDAAGVPNASVANGTTSVAGVSTGNSYVGLPEFSYTWSVNVPLSAGTYWLVLHNGPTDTVPDGLFFWEWSDAMAGNAQAFDPLGSGWQNQFSQFAFQIQGDATGTPEPASALLIGAGLLAIGFARAQTKQRFPGNRR